MNTDIEQELRELFREKVGEAPAGVPDGSAAPQRVLRRGRRRQIGTVLGSAALAAGLVVGTVAGLQSILRTDEQEFQTGPPGYDVFERVATIEAFTLGSPSNWFLVNEWPLALTMPTETSSESFSCVGAPVGEPAEPCDATSSSSSPIPLPYGLPMLQLSNLDVGLDSIACRDGLPSNAAVLYIAVDPNGALAPANAPRPPYPIGPGLPSPSESGPCGPGTYAHFTVNGTPMFLWIGIGDGVTDEDRATVRRTAEMMYADDAWVPSQPDHVTPAYVLAGGVSNEGETWRLELRPSEMNIEVTLMGVTPWGALEGFSVPETSIEWCCDELTPIFGAVTRAASGVEFRSADGRVVIPGIVMPPPPSLGIDFDLFFLEGADGVVGDVVATGLSGDSVSPSPSPEIPANVVELSGAYGEHTWVVRFTGAFIDGSACVRVEVDGETQPPLCPSDLSDTLAGSSPSLHGWLTSFYLMAGSVPDQVVDIRFVSDDGADPLEEVQCTMGLTGWIDPDKRVCVLTFPETGAGRLQYLDSSGSVLFEEAVGWSAASPAPLPTPVEPVHGGTYWAVYAWLGTANGPESNSVVDRLFDDYGVQAYQGDINCDQGATDVVGTEWAWRVAVYFETEQDAQLFAKRTDLIDAGPWEPVAEVTTYCLD